MKNLILILLLCLVWLVPNTGLAAFTEFYCNASTGSNMNGGDTPGSPTLAATNGSWSSVTGVFTPTSGNPSSTVTVGEFAHVFPDGTTTPTFIGRVTAVSSTTVTVSTTVKIGTAPTTAATGVSINVGGAWKGPNGTTLFPFGSLSTVMVNSSSNIPRANLKNNASYLPTVSLTNANAGVWFEGYSSTPGDGGKATIDAGGNAVVVINSSAAGVAFGNLIVTNNGVTGTNTGLSAGGRSKIFGCIAHDITGFGISTSGGLVEECEAYSCNTSNTVLTAGFSTNCLLVNCYAHGNTGSNNAGFATNGTPNLIGCIAAGNNIGVQHSGNSTPVLVSCDFYNNSSDGFKVAANSNTAVIIRNCNFVKNGGWGINCPNSLAFGHIYNCGFGTGTQVNTSGDVTTNAASALVESGKVTYASGVTPWVDPANGDFRVNLLTAKGVGRGSFVETSPLAGTIGYPDIGSAQHLDVPPSRSRSVNGH